MQEIRMVPMPDDRSRYVSIPPNLAAMPEESPTASATTSLKTSGYITILPNAWTGRC